MWNEFNGKWKIHVTYTWSHVFCISVIFIWFSTCLIIGPKGTSLKRPENYRYSWGVVRVPTLTVNVFVRLVHFHLPICRMHQIFKVLRMIQRGKKSSGSYILQACKEVQSVGGWCTKTVGETVAFLHTCVINIIAYASPNPTENGQAAISFWNPSEAVWWCWS